MFIIYVKMKLLLQLEFELLLNNFFCLRFQFSKEDIQDGKAYYTLHVVLTSKMIVICPHPSTYLENEQQAIPNEQRYEAVWYVDEQSFHDCKVGKPKGNINNVWLPCDTPEKLKFDTLVFQRFSPDSLVFQPGSKHYFIGKLLISESVLQTYKLQWNCQLPGHQLATKIWLY